MADPVLLLVGELGHGSVPALRDEDGVVPEALFAARSPHEGPLTDPLRVYLPAVGEREHGQAAVPGRPTVPRDPFQRPDELIEVLLVRSVLAGESGRPVAGAAAGGVPLDPRIICQRWLTQGGRPGPRFQEGVLEVGAARLLHVGPWTLVGFHRPPP